MRAIITINNNKCQVSGAEPALRDFRKTTRIRHPNAFWIRQSSNAFDGFIYVLTEYGYLALGHLEEFITYCKENDIEVVIKDLRPKLPKPKVPKQIGDKVLRDYQYNAVKSLVEYTIGNLHYPVGVLNMATNAGKTLMATAIHLSFKSKSIILLNDADLFEQFKRELPELMGEGNVGFVRGKEESWKDLTVCMVQTVANNIAKFKRHLIQYDVCIVDEADLADNKTYKKVITNLYNTTCRCGLSGSIYLSTLAKDKVKNHNLKGFFSNIRASITKREMMDRKLSAEVIVKMTNGNTQPFKECKGIGFLGAYKKIIINNPERLERILERIDYNMERGRTPLLVICQFKDHTEQLCKDIKKHHPKLKVEYAHSGVKDKLRRKTLEDFRLGHTDILVSSYIVKRGKNFPLIKSIINAGASDSNENILQILGRGERTHESKSKTYFDDFYDKGPYLERHSKHRINYYKKQQLKFIKLVK